MAKEKDTHIFIFYTCLSLPAEGGLKHKDHSHIWSVSTDQFTYQACVWTVGGSQSTQRKPIHAQREHANSTQIGQSQDSNPEPSCCEATVRTQAHSLENSIKIF